MSKVIKVHSTDGLTFDDGFTLSHEHYQDCCESHYLDFSNLCLLDFEGLEFDLSGDKFFTKIPDYGIALNPTNGFPVRVPGYGSNNGYYSTELRLVLSGNGVVKTFDITECQDIDG